MNASSLSSELFSSSALLVKGAFVLIPGASGSLAEKQLLPVGADIHTGEPEVTAVRYESDFVPFKPRADALCVGRAYPPGGLATECLAGFGVGPWFKTIRVVGNRRYVPVLGGLFHRIARPESFKSIVVSYENAFGGKDAGKPDGFRFYPRNPLGKGYSARGRGLKGLMLPNLEDPQRRIRGWRSRPRPMSFGPVGRTWEPRIGNAGTYDKKWLKNRSPRLPEDFQEAFYNCAPDDQQMQGYLRGDEEVRVLNMHPKHADLRFRLPGIRIRALLNRATAYQEQFEEIPMNLDTFWLDMEALQFVLVWRGRLSAGVNQSGPVLIVEERLADSPHPPDFYRPELDKFAAEEREADLEAEAAEKELEAMESVQVAEPVPASGAP